MTWTPERRAAAAAHMKELWRDGRYDNRRPPTFEGRCAVCARPDNLRHFNLVIQRKGTRTDRGNRGAGAIDLCRRCWTDATSAAARKPRPRLVREKAA